MYPNLFGITNFSYNLMMILGFIAAFLLTVFYLKKSGITKAGVIDLAICTCFTIVGAIIFAILFENIYELIQEGWSHKFNFHMTFFGGLIGGTGTFILVHHLMRNDVNFEIKEVVKVAPAAIALGHGFGRIGCFLAGCCHGAPTDSWIGLPCSQDNPGINVVPTQLIEAIFLFVLAAVLIYLLYKKNFKYNFVVYMLGYGVFRFVIEFFRADERGVSFFLSPSQVWSIILILAAIPLYLYLKVLFKDEKK